MAPTQSTFGKLNILMKINNEKKHLLFDTGASIFELATTPDGYRLFFGNLAFSEIIEVSSFGKSLTFKGKEFLGDIIVARKRIHQPFIYYSENPNVIEFLNESELFGVTGNALFLNDLVLIDFINSQFGLLPDSIYKSGLHHKR